MLHIVFSTAETVCSLLFFMSTDKTYNRASHDHGMVTTQSIQFCNGVKLGISSIRAV